MLVAYSEQKWSRKLRISNLPARKPPFCCKLSHPPAGKRSTIWARSCRPGAIFLSLSKTTKNISCPGSPSKFVFNRLKKPYAKFDTFVKKKNVFMLSDYTTVRMKQWSRKGRCVCVCVCVCVDVCVCRYLHMQVSEAGTSSSLVFWGSSPSPGQITTVVCLWSCSQGWSSRSLFGSSSSSSLRQWSPVQFWHASLSKSFHFIVEILMFRHYLAKRRAFCKICFLVEMFV